MNTPASGVVILLALAALAVGVAALALARPAGGRREGLGLLAVGSLVAGAMATTLLGHELPAADLAVSLPVGVGLLTALASRSLGYGLLSGLVVAAAML
ncbi:MAG TPA: hypothetical protein PKD53_28380 [Chloroflexaceae bacterium]|nr:hypothetical protein [Chloroflexaceae bacterium]